MTQTEITRTKYKILNGIIWALTLIIAVFFLEENGMGYFACAYESFILVCILMISAMPDSVSKMMRIRMQKNMSRNAVEAYKSALIISILYAVLGSLLLLLFSKHISLWVTGTEYSTGLIRAFIPAYIMYCLTRPLKGYFNGMGTAMPECISSIISGLVTLAACPFLMSLCGRYGTKIAELLHNTEFINSYKAYGMAAAFFLGMLFEEGFLIYTYFTNKRGVRGLDRESSKYHEASPELCVELMKEMSVGNIREFLLRLFFIASLIIYKAFYVPSEGSNLLSTAIGAYYGKYIAVVIFIAYVVRLFIVNIESSAISGIRRNELKFTREKLGEGIHMIICIAGYQSVAFLVLGNSLLSGLFGENNKAGTDFFTLGGMFIVLFVMAAFFMDFISYTSKKLIRVIIAFIGLAIGLLSCFLLCKTGKMGFKALTISLLIFITIILIESAYICIRSYRCRISLIYQVVIPVVSSLLTGVIIMLLNKALVNLVNGLVSFIICYLIGSFGNLIVLLAFHNISEEELLMIPGGKFIIKIGMVFNFF